MSRLFIRFISLVHGILAASAWAGVTAAAGAVRACIPASYRHFAPFLRTARVLLVVFGFGFGSLAFAQTASFSYAIVTLGGGFSSPNGVAVDGSGNVYAADWSNSAVKKMPAGCASSNCVTTLGGGFSYPTGVAVDGSGNVYVADRLNNAVKEMPAGCVSSSCVTALGGGFNHPTGVAVDRSGNVYVADSYNAAVKEIPAGCASLSCVTTLGGGFTTPNGVAVDGIGNVYVADAGNDAVKEMPTGCSLSTCVTKLGGGFLDPWGVAVDGSGNVYVADTNNNAVKEMPSGCASSGCVITLGGGFNLPLGVALDGSGNVYVGDGGHGAVKEIMAGAVNFYTVPVGTSSAATALTFTFDSAGSLGSTTPYQVLTQGATNLDFNAAATQESNACNGSTAYTAGESCTVDVIFTPEFPGPRYGAVVLESSSGVVATAYLQGTGTGPQVNFLPGTQSVIAIAVINKTEPSAWGVAVDGSGNVYISELDNDLVLKETLSAGTYTQTVIANNASNGLSDPTGVAVDGSGSVYIADTNNDRVLKEAPSAGGYTQSVVANYANNGLGVNGQEGPNGVAVDGSGNVYIADTVNSRVLKETLSAGTYTQSVVANSATNGLIEPLGVAVDGSGNVYIADTDSIRVLKETPSASTYTQSVVANSAT
ncbi:MAG: NHL repeat-containing protein, partial [Terracidiphilus sp.]